MEDDNISALVPRGLIPEDFRVRLQKKREEALKGLLLGETPQDVVRQRPGRGQMTFNYVPVAWFIEQLNLIFAHQWDFEVLDQEIVKDKQIWVKGKLTVRGPDGVTVTKTQFGGSAVKSTQDGKVIDIADDLKAASSDCLKKCATLLGLAWDVYSGAREALGEAGPSTSQLMAFYKRGEQAGLSKDGADGWFKAQTDINPEGKSPEEAVEAEILGAIPKLVQLAKEKKE